MDSNRRLGVREADRFQPALGPIGANSAAVLRDNGLPIAYSKKLPKAKEVYVVDFFSGCGGMSYGFATTRQSHLAYRVIAGIDIDMTALQTFTRNTGAPGLKVDVAALGRDPDILRGLLKEQDLAALRPLVFIGCAPCQGFSALRKGDHRDDGRNSLMMSFAKVCSRYRPDVVVMENVPEILGGRYSHYYHFAAAEFEAAGYKLHKGILDMSRYGVPQRRRRTVVLGSLSDGLRLPAPVFGPDELRTVREAIGHLRPLEAGEIDPYDPHHRAPNHTKRLVERFKATPPNGGDRRSLPAHLQLACHTYIDASDTPGFTDVYGRLRWDSPSVTITAKARSPSSGRFLHPEQHRNISVREAAILQGFPQSFAFEGSPTQQYRHIGEAVPPLFARFLAWQVLDHLRPRKKVSAWWQTPGLRGASHQDASDLLLVDGFSGAGGIGLGFKVAGIESALAFDIDPDAVNTFKQNLGEVAICADVRDPSLLTRLNEVVRESAFCVAGGPPCQGFSHQRRGESSDPRNGLVLDFADMIAATKRRPIAVLLENVTDLELPRGKPFLDEFLRRLRRMGFVHFRHYLNSADYGVPQLRNRILVVALHEDFAEHYAGPVALTPNRWPTVGEALADLPEPAASTLLVAGAANHAVSMEGELNKRRIAYVDMGSGRKSIPPNLQLPCHASDYRGHRDVYGRLDWFSQARTVTGGFDSFTRGEFAHPFRNRSITPREAARLQGFPDWFTFTGNRAAVRRQIGNAVPPPMAYAVALAIRKAVAKNGGI